MCVCEREREREALTMADPLSLLQKYHTEKRTDDILEEAGHIIFGDLAWPKDVKTNFRIYGLAGGGGGRQR